MHYNRMSVDELQLRIASIERHIIELENRKAWLTTDARQILRNEKSILKELKKELARRFVQQQFNID